MWSYMVYSVIQSNKMPIIEYYFQLQPHHIKLQHEILNKHIIHIQG